MPLKLPECLKHKSLADLQTKFVPKVSSPKAVGLIAKYWVGKYNMVPEAFVVEGPLAGGHLGFDKGDLEEHSNPLPALIEQSVEIVKPYEQKFGRKIPLIAAGGIYTGEDIYKIMQHGAAAIKMGTRFVTTDECDASLDFKMNYINSRKEDIVIIESPVGLPGRVIKNEFVNEIKCGRQKPFECSWQCLKSCDFINAENGVAG